MKQKDEYSSFSDGDLKTAFERQGCKCHRCGKELKFEEHTPEFDRHQKNHWSSHRFFKSSPYDAENCVILCNECGKKYIHHRKYILSPKCDVIDSSGDIKEKKSYLGGLLLILFFGVLGLLYANWRVALILIGVRAAAYAIWIVSAIFGNSQIAGVGFFISIVICLLTNRLFLMIYGGMEIGKHNDEIQELNSLVSKSMNATSEEKKPEA